MCLTSLGRASAFAANTTFFVEYQTLTNALIGYIIKSPLFFNTMRNSMFQPLRGGGALKDIRNLWLGASS